MLKWLSPALSPLHCHLLKHSFLFLSFFFFYEVHSSYCCRVKVSIFNVNEVKTIVTRETKEHNKAIPRNEGPSCVRESVITDKYCHSKIFLRKKKTKRKKHKQGWKEQKIKNTKNPIKQFAHWFLPLLSPQASKL